MKKHNIPLGAAIFLLIAGLFMGTVFTFGMQYWNAEVSREECVQVDTQILDYKIKKMTSRGSVSEVIQIECANGEWYDLDSVSTNAALKNALAALSDDEDVTLLIHPNSSRMVVGISTANDIVLDFDETIEKLGKEATGFMYIGIFMYFCGIYGFYHIIRRNK